MKHFCPIKIFAFLFICLLITSCASQTLSNKGDLSTQVPTSTTSATSAMAVGPSVTSNGNDLLGNASDALQNGDYSLALDIYNKLIDSDKTNPYLYAMRCAIFVQTGQPADAIADCRTAIKLDNAYAFPHIKLGDLWYRAGDYKSAQQSYRQAMKLEPDVAYSYLQAANIYNTQGAFDQAIVLYNRAIAVEPENAYGYLYRGIALHQQEQLQAAIADYATTLRLEPDNTVALVNRGKIYVEQGRNTEALADFDRAITLGRTSSQLFALRGHVNVTLARWQPAIADLNAALKGDPEYAYGYYALGIAYDALGDSGEAVTNFRRFLLVYNYQDELAENARAYIELPRSPGELLAGFFSAAFKNGGGAALEGSSYTTPNNGPRYEIYQRQRWYNPRTGSLQDSYCSNCQTRYESYYGPSE